MRRRSFLRASSATGLALTATAGAVSASPSEFVSVAAAEGDEDDGGDESGAETEDEFEPLGSVPIGGAAEVVVSDDGETAFLATTDGFATVDVSDPSDPTILAERGPLSVPARETGSESESDDAAGAAGEESGTEDGDGTETDGTDEADETAADGNERGNESADEPDENARPFTQLLDVEVDGDRMVLPGPANRAGPDDFRGFLLYDVSDPADPVPASDPYETDFHIHNCFFRDDLVYLVGNDGERNPLVIVDVSDDDPVEVGRWSLLEHDDRWADVHWLLWYLHDVYVQDDVAYLPYWNAGTYLVDVSDPTAPEYVSHVAETDVESQLEVDSSEVTEAQQTLPGNDHYAAVDETGDLLAVGREAWAADGGDPEGAGGIDLYDLSDPTSPERVSTVEAPETPDASYNGGMWTTSHNFELRGGLLFSSWYRGGVKVHDVTEPSSPEELAHWRDAEEAAFWTARVLDEETFVASATPLVPNAPTDGALYAFPIPIVGELDVDREGDGGERDGGGEGDDGSDTNSSADAGADDGDDDGAGADVLPGFTAPLALVGGAGALALERVRRRRDRANSSPERDGGRRS